MCVCVFPSSIWRCVPFPAVLMMKKISELVLSAGTGGDLGPLERTMYPSQPRAWGTVPARSLLAAQTKEPAPTTRGCSFSWSDDSFQFTKDSGQGSEKSGWLIRPYDFTLQRTRRKPSDIADSRGTAAGCWFRARGSDVWDRHGTDPSCSMPTG